MSTEHENLINSLIKDGYLKTQSIIGAFQKIDRADFVPEEYKSNAYANSPLPIGYEQTISQPLTVAFMLELLEAKPGEKILDVGSGSGWTVALLSELVGENGKVIGIERILELQELAKKNVSKYNFIRGKKAEIILADGSKGYRKEAPYDKIIAGAASQENVPLNWRKQLKIGGKIVSPVGNSILVIDKITKNKYEQKEYFGFSFVPLVTT